MDSKTISLFLLIFLFCSNFSYAGNSDTTYAHLNQRYRSLWQERNSTFSSTGIHILAKEYNIADRIGYKINGMAPLYNHTWYREGDVTRYSLREVVNFMLVTFAMSEGENTGGEHPKFYPKTALTYLMFLPNSEIRYQLNKTTFLSLGTETNYFFFRIKGKDRGMITSIKFEIPIEIHRLDETDRVLLAPFIKTNTFINYEGDNKWYGWSFGLKLISTTDSIFD